MNLSEYLILQESVKDSVTNVGSFVKTFYEHMAKWKYWQFEQASTWIVSISRSIDDIHTEISPKGKINKNIVRMSSENLKDNYNNGIKIASKANPEISKLAKKDHDLIFDEFSSLDLITNRDKVKEWLLEYSSSEKSKEIVNKGFEKE